MQFPFPQVKCEWK